MLATMENSSYVPILPQLENPGLPEVLIVTSYPPRECGIATYSQDLLFALKNKFDHCFALSVCALETEGMSYEYPSEVRFRLNTSDETSYESLTDAIRKNKNIKAILIQHEFGLFAETETAFLQFIYGLHLPVIVGFHTVLPSPDPSRLLTIQRIASAAENIIVMTNHSAQILSADYGIDNSKITVIPHGTHLVPCADKTFLKEKYTLQGKLVLSTFGLLSSGKSIETTLDALPSIVATHQNVLFLVLGKTHPGVVKSEGEQYRRMLEAKVNELGLQSNVRFVNTYLSLSDLLEYLQLTDIYLFTSKDPHQAVSGTFAYAMSCSCPIVSTPIPHAQEMLTSDTGVLFDFQNSKQLSIAVNDLLDNEEKRNSMSLNALRTIVPSAWENSANAHARLLSKVIGEQLTIHYTLPRIKLDHIRTMTTDVGILQFSKINLPDPDSGYTLDDNARALIVAALHYELYRDSRDLTLIQIFIDFIGLCQQSDGSFLNYLNINQEFTEQNNETNLEDSNGRAIWALGFLLSKQQLFPKSITERAETIFCSSLDAAEKMYSSRAMAFTIKGLCEYHQYEQTPDRARLIRILATRLADMYYHECEKEWQWFESYVTYGNAALPEAMLMASQITSDPRHEVIAKESFDFLLSQTFTDDGFKPISNKSWLKKGHKAAAFGEQPIDVAYTILALRRFYDSTKDEAYLQKLSIAFDWFLGRNHLHQVIYNPRTGGCYDGLEETQVNLNQGAESTLSYLLSRLTMQLPERPLRLKSFNHRRESKEISV